MKLLQSSRPAGRSRIVPTFLATVGISLATAMAVPNVNVNLAGKTFGNGRKIHATSGTWRLTPSKGMKYKVNATVRGTGALKSLVPTSTPLGAFMDMIAPGSGSLLSGTIKNPGGTFPVTVINRRIAGSERIKGLGKVSVSVKLKVEVLASGEVVVDLRNVKLTSRKKRIPGTIRFRQRSKLTISNFPEVTFKAKSQGVSETAGTVDVVVLRVKNSKGKAIVNYTTSDGTAVAGVDYTATSGKLVFGPNQTKKLLSIPIINNGTDDGLRRFKVELTSAGKGTLLGAKLTNTIGIADDD